MYALHSSFMYIHQSLYNAVFELENKIDSYVCVSGLVGVVDTCKLLDIKNAVVCT